MEKTRSLLHKPQNMQQTWFRMKWDTAQMSNECSVGAAGSQVLGGDCAEDSLCVKWVPSGWYLLHTCQLNCSSYSWVGERKDRRRYFLEWSTKEELRRLASEDGECWSPLSLHLITNELLAHGVGVNVFVSWCHDITPWVIAKAPPPPCLRTNRILWRELSVENKDHKFEVANLKWSPKYSAVSYNLYLG